MPRGRKRAASPEAAAELEDEERLDEMEVDGTAQALQFDEPLTWRAGKPIAVAELLRRLQALAEELQSIEQEEAVRDSLVPTAQELASPLLLGHKDSGVKAYTLVCIVEMFRLLAPDAPYKGRELKDIFTLFVSIIIPALASPDDAYNAQHLHVLHSLGTIKSICLLDGIPGCDGLFVSLFSNCFDVLSGNVRGSGGEQIGKNVEFHMTAMLTTVVDECSLPSSVIDIILAQFLRADPSTLLPGNKKGDTKSVQVLREVSPAYNMARAICNTCYEKMIRNIGQYFSSVLIDATQNSAPAKPTKSKGKKRTYDDSDEEAEDDDDTVLATVPSDEDLQEVEKAHRLLRELWRCCPDVIRNVMPQIEAEVSAENLQLRLVAVQTVGDMVAGIGAAGPPPSIPLDPAAYPSQSVEDFIPPPEYENVLLRPNAPLSFSSAYLSVYQGFMDRHRDKAAPVRSAWVTGAGRILLTSGGGKGLDADQEAILLRRLSDMLLDHDEKVRLSAVNAISQFNFPSIVQRIGRSGKVTDKGSILNNLADRIKDTKHSVRSAAIGLLSRIWGVAAGAIWENNENVTSLLGPIVERIFEAWYVNDPSIHALIQQSLHESILPVGYPPKSRSANGDSQRVPDSQGSGEQNSDPDHIRVQRLLVLIQSMGEKAKRVFFLLQQHQATKAKYIGQALQCSERINDQIDKDDRKEEKKKLEGLVKFMSGSFHDSAIASDDLTKFIDNNDRRNTALVRFCISPQSEYKKVVNALKELAKRLEQATASLSATQETVIPFMRQASILVYNKSHLPSVLEISRMDDHGFGQAAHEVLKEISIKAPEIFKVNIKELCEALKKEAPSAEKRSDPLAVESLKACAGFARRFPEGMAKDRDFYKAMTKFAMHGMPPTLAKQAVTVIIASADKKEMYIKDILKYCLKNFDYGAESFLSRLAALSQLRLLANKDVEDQNDEITEVTVGMILREVRTVASDDDPDWLDDVEEDDDLNAKLWALKTVVNELRGRDVSNEVGEPSADLRAAAQPILKLLNTLISHDGELATSKPTPKHHKAHLRLAAAKHLLKLCRSKVFDRLFSSRDFNRLANIVQDSQSKVRSGFNTALKKYLGQDRLPVRFYTLVFLYAFDPDKSTKEATITWLRSRAAFFVKRNEPVMEGAFSRLLSLLAHHQDFSTSAEDLEEFVEYILFYLKTVATEANLPQIYSVAQRVKSVEDGIDPDKSENLYALSDLAESIIRCYQELHGWSLQILGSKVRLPAGLFAPMPSHAVAQEVSEKRFVPEELADNLESIVRESMRTKKRKSEAKNDRAAKKAKAATGTGSKAIPVRRAPKTLKSSKPSKRRVSDDVPPSAERRKSSRRSNTKNYAENSDSNEDDAGDGELEQWQGTGDENKEDVTSSTPPTSDPVPVPPIVERRRTSNKATSGSGKKEKAASLPSRKNTRTKKTRDIMDFPSDSDEEDETGEVEA